MRVISSGLRAQSARSPKTQARSSHQLEPRRRHAIRIRPCSARYFLPTTAASAAHLQRWHHLVARVQLEHKGDSMQHQDDDKAKADSFHATVQSRFANIAGMKISDISSETIAPHPTPQFEIAFTKSCLPDILPWLIFNRPHDFSILVHPFTSDVVGDHEASATWLGKNLGADLTPLIDLKKKIDAEVKSGADEAALLWPFVYAEINSQSPL